MSKKKFGKSSREADLFGDGIEWIPPATKALLTSGVKSSHFERCFHSHPTLKLGPGTLYGGNCSSPIHKDAEVYVGLDYSAKPHAGFPWSEKTRVVDVYFQIPDMGVPKDSEEFMKMIDWLCNQLQAGSKVHVGCIGGHGRTGMVITAIVAKLWGMYGPEVEYDFDNSELAMRSGLLELPDQQMLKDREVIQWVRKHYCKKAVESDSQVAFLVAGFGVKKAEGSKVREVATGYAKPTTDFSRGGKPYMDLTPAYTPYSKSKDLSREGIHPVASKKNVWEPKPIDKP